MNKRYKKGFTIVELVIVIAVIAILAAVLIPTFSNMIKTAKTNADIQLVRNLNTAVALEKVSDGIEQYPTAHDAIKACVREGYIADRIVAKSSYDIAWNSTNGDFVLVDTKESKFIYPTSDDIAENTIKDEDKVNFFIMRAELPEAGTKDAAYSIYAREDWNQSITDVEVAVGFDAGDRLEIKTVNYTRLKDKDGNDISEGQNVIIRTNSLSTIVNIDAPKDVINHYEFASIVNVKSCASTSYHEYGTVGRVEIKEGRVEAMPGCEIFCLMDSRTEEVEETKPIILEGAIVHKNQTNIKDKNGNVGDGCIVSKNQDNGVGTGYISDCGAGRHAFDEHRTDYQYEYDICTCCGYTLVTIRANVGTANEVAFTQTLNKLNENGVETTDGIVSSPADTYTINKTIDVTTNTDGKIVVDTTKLDAKGVAVDGKIPTGIIVSEEKAPEVDNRDEEGNKKPIDTSCKHTNCIYVDNGNGTHTKKCPDCGLTYKAENHDGNPCSKCHGETIDGSQAHPFPLTCVADITAMKEKKANGTLYYKVMKNITFENSDYVLDTKVTGYEDLYKTGGRAHIYVIDGLDHNVEIDMNGYIITSNGTQKTDVQVGPYPNILIIADKQVSIKSNNGKGYLRAAEGAMLYVDSEVSLTNVELQTDGKTVGNWASRYVYSKDALIQLANGNICTVGESTSYKTLAEAVSAASRGQKITVFGDTDENIDISTKNINLVVNKGVTTGTITGYVATVENSSYTGYATTLERAMSYDEIYVQTLSEPFILKNEDHIIKSNSIVKLHADANLERAVKVGATNVILDLNGYTVKNVQNTINQTYNDIFNGANGLKVTDSSSEHKGKIVVVQAREISSGSISFENVTIDATDCSSSGAFTSTSSGKLTFGNGTVVYFANTNLILNSGTVIFEDGCVINGGTGAIIQDNGGIANFNGGTFNAKVLYSGTSGVNVYGGSFDRDPSAYLIENVTSASQVGGRWIVSLDHPENIVCYVGSKAFGTLASAIKFSSTSNKTIKLENDCSENIELAQVAEFTIDASEHQFAGSITVTSAYIMEVAGVNGHYKVVEAAKPYAKIGNVSYDSFQAALDAVKDGETIKILQNKNCDGTVKEVKKFTLDWSSDSFTYNQTIYLKVATDLYYSKPNGTGYVSSGDLYPSLRTFCAANATSAEINVINPVVQLEKSINSAVTIIGYYTSVQEAANYVVENGAGASISYNIIYLKNTDEEVTVSTPATKNFKWIMFKSNNKSTITINSETITVDATTMTKTVNTNGTIRIEKK